MNVKNTWIALAVCLAYPWALLADSWTYEDSHHAWRFSRGFRVELITDARRDGSARHYVKIVSGSRVLSILNGVAFETLVASPDEQLYVGLSNYGIPGTAAIVFDRQGRIILYASHATGNFAYCRASVTIERTWYDAAHPDVQFGEDGVISLNDCEGKRVNLLTVVGEALAPRGDPGG